MKQNTLIIAILFKIKSDFEEMDCCHLNSIVVEHKYNSYGKYNYFLTTAQTENNQRLLKSSNSTYRSQIIYWLLNKNKMNNYETSES